MSPFSLIAFLNVLQAYKTGFNSNSLIFKTFQSRLLKAFSHRHKKRKILVRTLHKIVSLPNIKNWKNRLQIIYFKTLLYPFDSYAPEHCHFNLLIFTTGGEAYLRSCQISTMKLFLKTFITAYNGLTIFTKSSIIDIREGRNIPLLWLLIFRRENKIFCWIKTCSISCKNTSEAAFLKKMFSRESFKIQKSLFNSFMTEADII